MSQRKVEMLNGEIRSFFIKGEHNPCGCGSNVFHHETDGKIVYGVCNACHKDIYYCDDEDPNKGEWEFIKDRRKNNYGINTK